MKIRDAVEMADALDLPDGAYMAYIEELTGCDAGDIAAWMHEHSEHAESCQCQKCKKRKKGRR